MTGARQRPSTPFPRLLYMGDVPVTSTYHGSALLYRLLESYPSDRIRVIEAGMQQSLPERRLPDVVYETMRLGYPRLLNTRFHEWYSLWLSLKARGLSRVADRLVGNFSPEAVLTVAHGYLWVTAAKFCEDRGVPLHLIVHDDWPRMQHGPRWVERSVDRELGRVYRMASSRLCVSPFMAAEYRERYGVQGGVLYPSRSREVQASLAVPDRVRERKHGLVVAFAGSINSPGYGRLLQRLAECLEPRGGTVLVFGPMNADGARLAGLDRQNIVLRGLLKSHELIERLRAEVDVLFVPMSFEASDHANMRISFPSKLADYTAVGLPILIMGPAY